MKENYDEMKKQIEELKNKIIEYFKYGNNDVLFSQLVKKFKEENMDILDYCLQELVADKKINKNSSLDHFEYDLNEDKEEE